MARIKKKNNGEDTENSLSQRADCVIDLRKSLKPAVDDPGPEIDRLKMVLSEMHEGIIITDTKNKVEWINRKACEILEIDSALAVGKSIKDFHNDSFIKDTKKFFDTFTSSELEFIEFEAEVKGKFINFRISPLHSKGQFYGIVRVLRDVTQNRRAQEQIRLLAKAINAAAEAIYIIDPESCIRYVNPAFCKITGYRKPECIGKMFSLLRSDYHEESFYRNMWSLLNEGQVFRGRIVNRRKDGGLYTAYCTISPVFGEDGQISNFVGVEKDITRELEIESQLLHSQKMEFVGRLTGGIAHDFNNMLTAIIGNSHLLLAELDEKDPLRQEAGAILKASLSAAGFIRQLLAFSRRQRGDVKALNLNYVINEMEPLLRRMTGENIKFNIKLDPDLKNIMADQGQLEQIIANLTVNAGDAMSQGGFINIETSNFTLNDKNSGQFPNTPAGNYVLLSFSDNGKGICPEDLNRIFEPFFTTKEKGKGTGLGLSIVYGIVKKYSGTIRVFSTPGQGAAFRIIFPAAEKDVELKEKLPLRRVVGGCESILLVEDEEVVRNFAVRVLERLGYRITASGSGAEAIECMKAEKIGFDLIVTDQVLSDMKGTGLMEELRSIASEKDQKFKTLFISGYPDIHGLSGKAFHAGSLFLEKPFTPEDLAVKVREALE